MPATSPRAVGASRGRLAAGGQTAASAPSAASAAPGATTDTADTADVTAQRAGTPAGAATHPRPPSRRQAASAGGRAPARRAAGAALALAGAVAGLSVLLDAVSTRFVPGNSDGATVVLEGAAMSGGNLALHGWAISLDSFWTLDVPFYAVATLIGGVRGSLMNAVPAVIAACLAVLGASLAAAHRRGLAAVVAAGTVLGLLALPSPDLAFFLLQGPWHVATTAAALVAFALLARPGFSWRWLGGVALMAAGLLGDIMILTFGLLPLLAGGLAAAARRRSWRAGAPTMVAAPAAAALALGVRAVAQLAGTFTLVNRNLPIRWHQLAENIGNLGNRLPGLLGVGTIPHTAPGGAPGFQIAHVAGLMVVLAATVAGLVSLVAGVVRGPGSRLPDEGVVAAGAVGAAGAAGGAGTGAAGPAWRLDDLLVAGIVADVVTFVWAAGSNNTDYAKYLTPGVVLAAVLAGRLAGRLTERVHGGGRRLPTTWRVALGCAAALVGLFGAEVGTELAGAQAVQPARRLSAFLVAHGLRHGVGDYWSSTVVAVDSGGAAEVRPVAPGAGGRLRRYERQSPESWYAGQRFDFFVFDTAHPWRGVDATTAELTWGRPSHAYGVGTYRVLVWSRPFTVSTSVPSYGSPLQIFWSPGAPRGAPAPRAPSAGH